MTKAQTLTKAAQELRKTVVDMIHAAGSGHSGGSLSCAEILTVLYDEVLQVRPQEPRWPGRDRFVLSKGHAAPALYAILARKGFFEPRLLGTLRKLGSRLQGHPCMLNLPGIEMSTGLLGMGISVGVGMALAARLRRERYRIFVLCGDGEMQEGQNWEALMSAAKWNLDNLTVIIDRNHVQLDGPEQQIMPMGSLGDKIAAFGLHPLVCNGHDTAQLLDAFHQAAEQTKPCAIIAETVKGKGVSFMEGQSAWHGKPIGKDEYAQAIRELEEARV
jgi:transketolase